MIEGLTFPTTAFEIARFSGGAVIGDPDAEVRELVPLEKARQGSLSFIASRKYARYLSQASGAVVFADSGSARPELPLTYIVVPHPLRAFTDVARTFLSPPEWDGVSPHAFVDATALVEERARIGAFAWVGARARIGRSTIIHPHAYVGERVQIGESCELFPRVVVLQGVQIGKRVKIFPGSVIGSDGFGYFFDPATDGGTHIDIPQIGTVVIEDDVRIGALCTIDRATLGETRIGSGSKIDDHVHIAHNCKVGARSILCGQAALAGSVELGEGSMLAGQVGIGQGVKIGPGARIAGQTGVGCDLPGNETYFLSPAMPMSRALKVIRYFRKLPEIWNRLGTIEKHLGMGRQGRQEGELDGNSPDSARS